MKNMHSIGDDHTLRVNKSLKNIRKHNRTNGKIAPIEPLGPAFKTKVDRNVRRTLA